MSANDEGYKVAIEEGRQSVKEGGVGIGSCIVGADGKILGRGRNMRKQNGSHILHAETAAFDQDRSLTMSDFHCATLYTTMSCCPMCTGAAIWFKVAKVVIGDNINYRGPEDLLKNAGIEVVVLNTDDALSLSDSGVLAALN